MNVLITSVSRKVPMVLAVRQALARTVRGGRVFGGDSDPWAIARGFLDEFWEMPPWEALTASQLKDYCAERQIRWVVPSRDGEVQRLSEWREELRAAGIWVMAGTSGSVEACCDKRLFAERLAALPEVVPVFDRPQAAFPGSWVVKERYGSGSRGALLDLPAGGAALRAEEFDSPLFQPFVEGREYSADLYRSHSGAIWGCVVRSRDRVVGGESQISTVVRHDRVEDLCRRAAELLDVAGHVVFQAIEARGGELHLLECNARFGGASTLAVAAGLNSFGWFFRETLDPAFAPPAFVRGTPGLRLTRYPADRIELET